MAATVSASVNDKGVFRAVVTVQTNETPATVYVGHLRDVTIHTRRSAGSTGNTLAVTGSNDGTNFAAVTSTTQVLSTGDGGDDSLAALTNADAIHTIRQKCEYLRFTPSDDQDTFTIVVSGVTRN